MTKLENLVTALADPAPRLAEDLRRLLAMITSADDFATVPSRSGAPTLSFRGRFLHSSVDPLREARRLAATAGDDGVEPDIVFCFGVGLGYHIEAFRRLRPDVAVVSIVVDPNEITHTALHHDDRWWRDHGPHRIVPYGDSSAIWDTLEEFRATAPVLRGLTGFRSVFSEQWRNMHHMFRVRRDREQVNRNTLRRFGKRWVRNTIRNLARYGGIPGIDGLAGSAAGLHAVVFGAGPTLDEIAPIIADVTDTVLVIAVDTAIPALARHGLIADVAVIADPQYWNSRHLDRVHPVSTVLLAEPATYSRVFRLWRGPRLVSASLFPLGEYLDRKLGRTQRLGAGGSVATSAWDLARLLGADTIGLAGIDLGFPYLRTHCAGSFFEQRLIATGSRLRPAEHGMARYLHGGIPSRVERAGGGTVLSDQRMSVYRSWFTEQVRGYPETRTLLLSPESSAIPGVLCVSAKTFRQDLPSDPGGREKKRAFLEILHGRARISVSDPPAADTIIDELYASFARLEERAHRGRSFCREHHGSSDPRLLRHLDDMDRELLAASEGEMAGFIAAEAIMNAAGKTARSIDESLSQASEIYAAIAESCTFHRSVIERARSR